MDYGNISRPISELLSLRSDVGTITHATSNYIRYAIFRRSIKKEASLGPDTKEQLTNLDYELNRIGVNLNQLSKKINSFSTYTVGDNDRHLLKQAFHMMMQCLAFLQKHLR